MSMLIIGANPPNSCYACSWYNKVECPVNNGRYYYRAQRHPSCPLVEIPTPHGRLGDLDKLEEQFKRAIETYIPKDPTRHMDVVTSNRCHAWCNGLTVIQDVPTVIEAEGSETNA